MPAPAPSPLAAMAGLAYPRSGQAAELVSVVGQPKAPGDMSLRLTAASHGVADLRVALY